MEQACRDPKVGKTNNPWIFIIGVQLDRSKSVVYGLLPSKVVPACDGSIRQSFYLKRQVSLTPGDGDCLLCGFLSPIVIGSPKYPSVAGEEASSLVGTRRNHCNKAQKARPAAAEKENFGSQANKGILAERIALELNVPRRTAARVLDAVLDSVSDLLRGRGKVAVKGFGTFERKIRKGRAYKHPLTGQSISVADKETIMFKPSDQLISNTKTGAQPRTRKSKGGPPDEILFKG